MNKTERIRRALFRSDTMKQANDMYRTLAETIKAKYPDGFVDFGDVDGLIIIGFKSTGKVFNHVIGLVNITAARKIMQALELRGELGEPIEG